MLNNPTDANKYHNLFMEHMMPWESSYKVDKEKADHKKLMDVIAKPFDVIFTKEEVAHHEREVNLKNQKNTL